MGRELGQSNMDESKYNKYDKAPKALPAKKLINKKSILKTDKGTIEIELFGDEAPLTVSNHIFLVEEKFYDGLIFHRREEGFVIQGGDPIGKGYGGPGYRFEDEPVMRQYDRGIVAMANSGPDTNGSQFFIMLEDVPLPPLYTIFGKVIKGIETIDKIEIGDKIVSAKITDLKKKK
jgi:cyclophilin family peptidyl-prolyl cis-trans isomerase